MKVKIFSWLMVAAMVVSQSGLVLAQGRGWTVVQGVAVDERVIVKQKDGKTLEGKMIEATETNLSISRDKKVVNISRDNITQVEHVLGKANKTKWAAIGAGVGAGTGLAIGAAKANTLIDDGEIYTVAGVIFGAGIGAGVGAIFGASRRKREVIYSAP